MPKTVSVSEAKNQLSAVMDWAVDNGDEVVIESRGKPKVAILSYGAYQEFLALREQARRREAFRQLEELAEQMSARNADLSAEEVEQLADEITRETLERMEAEGKIKFQLNARSGRHQRLNQFLGATRSGGSDSDSFEEMEGRFTPITRGDHGTHYVRGKPRLVRRIPLVELETFANLLEEFGERVARIEEPFPAVTRDRNDDFLLAYAQVCRPIIWSREIKTCLF